MTIFQTRFMQGGVRCQHHRTAMMLSASLCASSFQRIAPVHLQRSEATLVTKKEMMSMTSATSYCLGLESSGLRALIAAKPVCVRGEQRRRYEAHGLAALVPAGYALPARLSKALHEPGGQVSQG